MAASATGASDSGAEALGDGDPLAAEGAAAGSPPDVPPREDPPEEVPEPSSLGDPLLGELVALPVGEGVPPDGDGVATGLAEVGLGVEDVARTVGVTATPAVRRMVLAATRACARKLRGSGA
jgi:hypothetical protein